MFDFTSQHPIHSLRSIMLPWLSMVAASLALGACQGTGDTLAPTSDLADEPAAAPSDIAVSGQSLITTQRILFMSYKGTNPPQLSKIDPQGNSRVPLGSAQWESSAAWSHDNKRIALVRQRPRNNTTEPDIYVINADGTNGHWASPTPTPWAVMDPSWSPDGSRLLVRAWAQDIPYLAWMNVTTGQITFFNPLDGGIIGTQPSYNASGTKIIYVGLGGKTIHQVNADGSNHKIRFSSTTYVYAPSYSPVGNKIAFARIVGTANNSEIFVKNFADGTLKRLTTHAATDYHPSWSPDGTRIAFASSRSGTDQIWTMNAATGGSLVRITHNTNWENTPAWSY